MSQEQLGKIEAKIDGLVLTVRNIDSSIHGNGSPGLKTEVDRNTQAVSDIKKFIWIILTTLTGVIAAVLLK